MTAPNAPSRATVETAVEDLTHLPGVASVAIRAPPEHDHGHRFCVSVLFEPGHGRVPPRLCRAIARYDLGIADVSPQGDQLIVAAV
jgi:hypothetical protein